jgi:hypothetical protein
VVVSGTYQMIRPPINDTLRVILLPDDELDFVPTYYPSTIDWRSAGLVIPGQNTNNIDVSVYRISPVPQSSFASVIRGTIHLNVVIPLDPPGSYPYRSSSVLYIKQGNLFKKFATSGTNENYVTSQLNPGTYELFAYRLGYCMASTTFIINPNTTDTTVNFVLDTCSVIGIQNIGTEVPKDYLLKQNYPNPFNPVTTIDFSLPSDGFVELKIYDILGREIASLVNELLNKGEYKYVYDAGSLSSGIYFYQLVIKQSEGDPSPERSGSGRGFTETKKMVLIK